MPRFRDTELSLNPSVPRKERVKDPKNIMRSVDPAALEMLAKYNGSDISTGYSRYAAQQPQCAFGYEGVCCRICIQGPCRVKGLEGDKSKGICGARDYTIVARNIARAAAGGASAHSDHGREIVYTMLAAVRGETGDFKVKDEDKLRRVAANVGITVEGKDTNALAEEMGKEQHAPVKKGHLLPAPEVEVGKGIFAAALADAAQNSFVGRFLI